MRVCVCVCVVHWLVLIINNTLQYFHEEIYCFLTTLTAFLSYLFKQLKKENAHRISVVIAEETRLRLENIIKVDFAEMSWKDSSDCCDKDNEHSASIKCEASFY